MSSFLCYSNNKKFVWTYKRGDHRMINVDKIINRCQKQFDYLEKIFEENSIKILNSFRKNKISESHFSCSTGYGYENSGRTSLNNVFKDCFDAEDAFVSENFVSGTHAISTSLFAVTNPGDLILFLTGIPYDTLNQVLNGNNCCSLKDLKINSLICDFLEENIENFLKRNPRVVYIQRSRGYSIRKSLTISEIENLIERVKKISPNSVIIVDNCYGEFVENLEPTSVGADLAVGSLIKNPGGGIAPSGGYIVGKKHLVKLCEQRFLAPGLHNMGASFHNRELFMGIFYAPLFVREAVKSAIFASALFEDLGFKVYPSVEEKRADIVTSIDLERKDNLLKFCESIQKNSPVDSFITPVPWKMPGYDHEVIMSSGGFISGSSIELSADAPVKPPYRVFFQGGTNFYIAKRALINAAESVVKRLN